MKERIWTSGLDLQRGQRTRYGNKMLLDIVGVANNGIWSFEETLDGSRRKLQSILKKSRIMEILKEIHSGIEGGRFLTKSLKEFVIASNCTTCAAAEIPRTRNGGRMR